MVTSRQVQVNRRLCSLMPRNAPDPTDKYVGSRVRMRRLMLGMSQAELGDALGVTFQQVQKYENGRNRIAASRLQHMTRILQVPLSFFFDEVPSVAAKKDEVPGSDYVTDFLSAPGGLKLAAAFQRITDQKLRRYITGLIVHIAEKFQ